MWDLKLIVVLLILASAVVVPAFIYLRNKITDIPLDLTWNFQKGPTQREQINRLADMYLAKRPMD
ncbi:hypothetical protein [Rubinisphaera italica]|uniref:Uncharacterized protein n=1 Tax=Rubinisphaera italica TaxID=2527969 RepID=A0A5C5XFC2_9PLAN|nr:hypothetical protein [Rubinisphaera italica]TWT60845.1 hypothetical protein Pan54_15720 [Rubinisphaera italica]